MGQPAGRGPDLLQHLARVVGELRQTLADRSGRRTRLYDTPATPLDRLLAAKVLSRAQEVELVAYRGSLNPAAVARQIADIQASLLKLAKDKTEQLYLASVPTALPDVRKGIRVKAS